MAIIVHDTFVCKPGNASKLAKLFKEWSKLMKGSGEVMTDLSGQWHRVIMVSRHKSLADWEKNFDKMPKGPKARALMKKFESMNEMYVSGNRDFYKAW